MSCQPHARRASNPCCLLCSLQHGGYGSAGYGYDWKVAEAEKNLLRTHTTAVSSRMLHRLAQVGAARHVRRAGQGVASLPVPPWQLHPSVVQEGFRPAKYFSIDRVFRNEAIDRTHLAEFHQIEGALAHFSQQPKALNLHGRSAVAGPVACCHWQQHDPQPWGRPARGGASL
jgi:hypothetical protein